MWFVAAAFLLALVSSATSSGIVAGRCPIGYKRINGFCMSRFDSGDYDYEVEPKPQRPDCTCVPHYVCSAHHVVTQRAGTPWCSNTTEEVCCSDFAMQPNADVERDGDGSCGWSPSDTAASRNETAASKNQTAAGRNETAAGRNETATGEAAYGEFPWVVAILKLSAADEWSDEDYVGAGAVIHPRVVLTAAHKLDGFNVSQLKCRAGEWSRNESEPQPREERRVRRLVVHEGYNRKFMANSIALVFLERPFDTTRGPARAACVARQQPDQGAACVATGWGRRHLRGEFAHRLKKISVPVSRRPMCQAALRQTRLGRSFTLHSSALCAGGVSGADVCTGDGGAPLLCPIQRNGTAVRYAVCGLAAWGVGCGARGVPGVYVDVAQFHAWLHAAMEARGLATASFLYQL